MVVGVYSMWTAESGLKTISTRKKNQTAGSSRAVILRWEAILVPQETLAMSGDIFGCHNLISKEQRPGLLLNILQHNW